MKITALSIIVVLLITSYVYAYNPHSFYDEEELLVQGNRPKVDITLSAFEVTINPEEFVDGIAEKNITISNEGNVPCRLNLTLKDVPVDLKVEAIVDSDFLLKGESTSLNIVVELSDMQETSSFSFKIIVEARLRP
jgi:hypothetical protein